MKRLLTAVLFTLAGVFFLTTPLMLGQRSVPGKVRIPFEEYHVKFEYPANWTFLNSGPDGDCVIGSTDYETFHGASGLTLPMAAESVEFGYYNGNARDLLGAAIELQGRFYKHYPYLHYPDAGNGKHVNLNGHDFLVMAVTHEYGSEGKRKGFLWITKEGDVFWFWLFVTKPEELQQYFGTIEAVMNSIIFPLDRYRKVIPPASTSETTMESPNKPDVLTSQEIAKKAFSSVVMLVTKDSKGHLLSLGSGFVVEQNLLVTNLHVWSGAKDAVAKFVGQDEHYRITQVVRRDAAHDLVLLRIEAPSAPALPLAKCNDIAIGDKVYAVGNPEGLEGTFSDGIVSAVRDSPDEQFIQITAPISHGSSGGPVLNVRGEVVGVSTAMLKGGQNLNFAIPSCYVSTLLSSFAAAPSR